MDDSLRDLVGRLMSAGAVTLDDRERAVVLEGIRMLGDAERLIALQGRLLESFGQDLEAVARLLEADTGDAFSGSRGVDFSRHERARESLRAAMDRAGDGAEWVGAVLDFVRVVAL